MSVKNLRDKKSMIFGMLALCLVGIAACSGPKKSNEATPVLSRQPNTAYPMPPLNRNATLSGMGWALSDKADRQSFQGQEQKRAKVSDYRGKILVLDFYATWCEPCRESVPGLIALQKRYEPRGLQVVGLNVGGPDDQREIASFAKELGIQYPLGIPDESLTDLLLSDNGSIPQTFVLDRKGQLVKRFIGYGDYTTEDLEKVVRDELERSGDL
jgi:thiol-disulfide isomerase/thioredoxin